MKKLYTIAAALMMTASVLAQSPEKMSYQAVVRNSSDALITTQAVGIQISILQGSSSGTAVYTETQTPTTNANGLVSLEIGSGTVVSGTFNTIDWSAGPYFIKTEIDPTGGTTYTITGTSQLMSVPFALHAKTAENVVNDANTQLDSTAIASMGFITSAASGSNDKFYLGKDTLGGIVYYIYKDATGTQHGLIVNKTDSTLVKWQATSTLTNADRTEDGAYNTALMTSSDAATYVTGLGAGWYLPSIDELGLLYYNRFTTNKALRAGSFTLLPSSATYWSSSEININSATFFRFSDGYAGFGNKGITLSVRAVRAF